MKKTMIVICILVLVLSSFSVGFAAEMDKAENEEETARFVGTHAHVDTLTISSSGYATMLAELIPKTSTSIDKVVVTIKLKSPNGTNVYNKSHNATWSQTYFEYQVDAYKQLTTKGEYTMYVTYKCYKDGSLIETISGSASDTY